MSDPSRKQVGGNHYAKHAIQPWDALECWLGADGFEAYLAGSAVKYIARYKDKNGVEDLRKAAHYIERLIEHLDPQQRAEHAGDDDERGV
jgi:hypothetical protein